MTDIQSMVDKSALDAIYLSLLNRPADAAALREWTGRASIAHVLEQVTSSNEFRDNVCHLLSASRRHDSATCSMDTKRFYEVLGHGTRTEAYFEQLMRKVTSGGKYFEYHRKRFSELHCYIDNLNATRPVRRILDISTMPFTTMIYSHYLSENITVTTIDLPADRGGPSNQMISDWRVSKHIPVDLNYANLNDLADEIVKTGPYDLILGSEVIEHLMRDFAEIVTFILRCLSVDGVAIITTPNYLSPFRMRMIAYGESPQQRFKDFRSNFGGHYHFREYTMKELVSDAKHSGAVVLRQIYSNCYEINPGFETQEELDLRDCMVLMFGKSKTCVIP